MMPSVLKPTSTRTWVGVLLMTRPLRTFPMEISFVLYW